MGGSDWWRHRLPEEMAAVEEKVLDLDLDLPPRWTPPPSILFLPSPPVKMGSTPHIYTHMRYYTKNPYNSLIANMAL